MAMPMLQPRADILASLARQRKLAAANDR